MSKILTKEQLKIHKRKLLVVALAVIVLSITAVGYISTFNEVVIEDGEETIEIQTRKETVEEVLLEAGVEYIEKDRITPGLETAVTDGMEIQIIRAVNVEISDDEEKHTLLTPVKTVEDALKEARILIRTEDEITPSLDTELEEGMQIDITRAVPCEIQVDGELIELMTTKETVKAVLEEAEVSLGEEDKINYDLDDSIKEDMEIEVIRVEKEIIDESERIDYKTIRENDGTLEKGKSRVEREGQEGQLEREIEITYENGEEVSREILAETVVQEPVNRIVKIGTKAPKPAPIVSRGGSEVTRTLTVEATAYSSQDPGVGTITATGATLRHGIIAVDPRVIPLGTKIYVPGYGYGIAADTGGAIKGNRIDLAYENRSDALQFGRRMKTIKIYD